MFSLTPLGDLTRFRRNNVKNEAYLITEDVCIKVHGIILAARSAKIEVMLEESENIPAVEFSDDLTGLEDCLDLVYGGSVEIREDKFKTIYKFGKLFQIREMMESVLSFRTITKILFDTSIHTVTSTDTSSQPSTSSTFFTSPSISKETSQPLPLPPPPPASSSTSTSQLIPSRKKESKRMGLPRHITSPSISKETSQPLPLPPPPPASSSTFTSQLIPN